MAEFGHKLGKSAWTIKYAPGRSCQFPRVGGNRGSRAGTASCRTTRTFGSHKYAPVYGGRKCPAVRIAGVTQGSAAQSNMCTPEDCLQLYTARAGCLFSIGRGPFGNIAGFSSSSLSGIGVSLSFDGPVDQLSTLTEEIQGGLEGKIVLFEQRIPPLEMCKSYGLGKNTPPTGEANPKVHTYYLGCPYLLNKIWSPNQTWDLVWKRRDCLTSLLERSQQRLRCICTLRNLSAKGLKTNVSLRLWVRVGSASRESSSSVLPLHRSKTAYYDVLQVSPSATQAQIKTAYYKQSFIYHPDRNGGSEAAAERFTEIGEAYSVLGSITLRRKYDRGILTQADLRGSGSPFAEEARGPGATATPREKARRSSVTGAGRKPVFDFDAFYQAHYGDQLRREREIRWRREELQRRQKEGFRKWKLGKLTELSVAVLLALGMSIIISIHTGH